MAGALAYQHDHPDGQRVRLARDVRPGAYKTPHLIGVLERLGVQLGHQPVTLVWDNLPAHHSRAMRAWLGQPEQDWLRVVHLSADAPDLGPGRRAVVGAAGR